MKPYLLKGGASFLFYLGQDFLNERIKSNSKNSYQKNSSKISRNIICLVHTILTLIFILSYDLLQLRPFINYMSIVSTGYFIFDTYYILKFYQLDTLKFMYLYHHGAIIYSLSQHEITKKCYYMAFLWAEISNIPLYVVYHLIKSDPESKLLTTFKKIQKYTYLFARVPMMSYYTYLMYLEIENRVGFYITLPVYFLGVIWTICLFLI